MVEVDESDPLSLGNRSQDFRVLRETSIVLASVW